MAGAKGAKALATYHDDFRLSITKALGDQLAAALDKLTRVDLTLDNIADVQERPGVYQLYLNDEFVYVGKAEASQCLPNRLRQHRRKISGRRNINLDDVKFSCLYVEEDFSALAPERLLINHYKRKDGIPWNNNGFGNKDPGKQRDTTILKKNHFDLIHPINLQLQVAGIQPGDHPVESFLESLKSSLPFNFRYDSPPDAKTAWLTVPDDVLTADEAFHLVSSRLPDTWQITVLGGYVIMYRESKKYESAFRYYRAGVATDSTPKVSSKKMTADDEQLQFE